MNDVVDVARVARAPDDLEDVLNELMRRVQEGRHTAKGDRLEVRLVTHDGASKWRESFVVLGPFDPATCIAQPPTYLAKRTPSVGWS